MLVDCFGGRAVLQRPFDAVARGACRGAVVPILQHDYAIESYNAERGQYEFAPLFRIGTDYPTREAVQLWARGSYDGMTKIALKIFEVSRMRRAPVETVAVDAAGALLEETQVRTDFAHVCLNRDNPTFIVADPPVKVSRDRDRFLCSFRVDEQRRLLVTVTDKYHDRRILDDHPVVRL
jgi:hypothetical protein